MVQVTSTAHNTTRPISCRPVRGPSGNPRSSFARMAAQGRSVRNAEATNGHRVYVVRRFRWRAKLSRSCRLPAGVSRPGPLRRLRHLTRVLPAGRSGCPHRERLNYPSDFLLSLAEEETAVSVTSDRDREITRTHFRRVLAEWLAKLPTDWWKGWVSDLGDELWTVASRSTFPAFVPQRNWLSRRTTVVRYDWWCRGSTVRVAQSLCHAGVVRTLRTLGGAPSAHHPETYILYWSHKLFRKNTIVSGHTMRL